MREQTIQAVDIIPIKVVLTNFSYGRYVTDFGIDDGYVFDKPMIDFVVKNNNKISAINEEQLMNFGWLAKKELVTLKNNAYRINDFITGLFAGVGLRLVQIKLQFGRIFNGEDFILMLAGEISPETCVLQSLNNNEQFNIEMLSQSVGAIHDNGLHIYQEVAKRLA
jgi:phosphoribosylaminoimidazole-succinocarboxamide synthase